MGSYALIKDGKIFNVISADSKTIEQIGLNKLSADHVVDITGTDYGIGFLYDEGIITRPVEQQTEPKPPTVEERLTALEAEVAAVKAGMQ